MNPIQIRPLTLADLNQIDPWIASNATFREYGMTGEKLRPSLEAALTQPEAWLIAADLTENGKRKFAGFAWCIRKGAFGRSGYLRLIAIHPELKSRGIGKDLLSTFEKEFTSTQEKKTSGFFLLCTHSNTGARAFYEKLGYQQVGEIPNYILPGLHEILYFKP